jgi:hypothetical protein
VGDSIEGSGTVSTRTSRLPWKVTAFIAAGPTRPACAYSERRELVSS